MMRSTAVFAFLAAGLAGCGSPPSQPQDTNVVNGTVTDQAFPSGAEGNDIITGSDAAAGAGDASTTNNSSGEQGESPRQN